jgi:hypothetical protein
MRDLFDPRAHEPTFIRGGRCAFGPNSSDETSLLINDGRFQLIVRDRSASRISGFAHQEIDLSGYLILPGLINAHDHLHLALYPQLGNPPYRNYIDWGEDIHATAGNLIARHKCVPKQVRLWWGGIRNLLCGVTTVCHHDPLWQPLRDRDFPVRVVQRFRWAHSLALGGDVGRAHSSTPVHCPFIIHIGEGIDDIAKQELFTLDRLGALDASTVVVHGLAVDRDGMALMQERRASLIVCPSSNHFLFGRSPDITALAGLESVALGNDSPLTAAGDLLDELRFAISHCDLAPETAYRMVTTAPAKLLHLQETAGTIRLSGPADLVAVRDTGVTPVLRLTQLSIKDVELVIIGGRLQLASDDIRHRLSLDLQNTLQPLEIDGILRWLRAPVTQLLGQSEEILGLGQVRLGGRLITMPSTSRNFYPLASHQASAPWRTL